MNQKISRRLFLSRAATAGIAAPWVIPSAALGLANTVAPSNRVAMGFIGLGGKGTDGLENFRSQSDVQVVALCDASTDNRWRPYYAVGGLEVTRQNLGLPPENAHRDFRQLLDRGDIDAVQIAIGSRWHPVIAAAAARAGKDIYCEKPLARSVADCQSLREACRRYGTVFQFGTQQRSYANFRLACELVRNEKIGKLKTIKVGVYGSYVDSTLPGTYEPGPVVKELDYDLWTGPAPMRPFVHGVASQGWSMVSDYEHGWMQFWGVHHMDTVQWGAGTDDTGPVEIEGKGVRPRLPGYCNNHTAWCVEMRYADGARVIYTDNADKTEQQLAANDREWLYQQVGAHPKNPQGVRFEGTDGWVFVKRGFIDAEPKSLLQTKLGPDDIRLPRSALHERNFLDCVKSRTKTISDIDTAVRSDTLCHLVAIAFETGQKLRWDPVKEKFIDNEEANRLLTRPMRGPWRV